MTSRRGRTCPPLPSSTSPHLLVAGLEFGSAYLPGRLFVERLLGGTALRADSRAVGLAGSGGHLAAWGLVHEWHELVWEAGHRAADADATDVRTSSYSVHPVSFGHVAVDDRVLAAELDQAFR